MKARILVLLLTGIVLLSACLEKPVEDREDGEAWSELERVSVRGMEFVLGDEAFHFTGAFTFPPLTHYAHEEWRQDWKQEIDGYLDSLELLNVRVIRFLAFGSYEARISGRDEPDWERMDYLIQACEKRGVYVIFVLWDYWDYGEGEQGTLNRSLYEFWEDGKVKPAATKMVNRYRNSNAVFAWELINEGDLETMGDHYAELYNWTKEMSEHVKTLDSNHLVSTGFSHETLREAYFQDPESYARVREKAVELNSLPGIDFMTFHGYGGPPDEMVDESWYGPEWEKQMGWFIEEAASIREEIGKPVLFEEWGGVQRQAGPATRQKVYSFMLEKLSENRIDGLFNGWEGLETTSPSPAHVLICARDRAEVEIIKKRPGGEPKKERKEQGGTKRVENASLSGHYPESQEWSGEIKITGDTNIEGDLTILPGTVVRFVVGDDQGRGGEVEADGYNDLDPTRLKSYEQTHSDLGIKGKLVARGTPEKMIVFTSAAEEPGYVDWVGIHFNGDGSVMEYCLVEWSRNGIAPGSHQPNTVIRKNVVNYTFWGAICTGWSSAQVFDNEVWEAGHEGIDVQGGNPVIENNRIYNVHAGIVVLRGSAVVKNNTMINVGNGIHVGKDATPVLEGNEVQIAPEDWKKEWRYGDFAYPLFGDPAETPVLTEVYTEEKSGLPRYACAAYRIEERGYEVELPVEAGEWLVYGWEDGKFKKLKVEIEANTCTVPPGYSLYVFIPNPLPEETDEEKFNHDHADIYEIMAV